MSVYTHPQLEERAKRIGKEFYQSGLFGLQSEAQGYVMALEMIVTNKTPFSMMQTYHVISGKVSKAASAMLAEFNRLGGKHKVVQYDENAVEIVFEMNGVQNTFRITWEEAQKEKWPYKKDGSLLPNWNSPLQRAAMLFARTTTRAIRAICPQVNAGEYSPEELGEAPPADWGEQDHLPGGLDSRLPPQNISTRPAKEGTSAQAHLDEIRMLVSEIIKVESDFATRLESKLNSNGINKLADLSMSQAESLIDTLRRKIVELNI